jgi:hypothetical protein
MNHKGCGPGATALWIPQFIFEASCGKHDELYRIGGGLIAKLYADFMFFAYMLKDIKKGGYGFWRSGFYLFLAIMYLFLVSTFGIFIFNWHF